MIESYKNHIQKNIALALPVMLTQVGQITVNVADNVMVGKLGKVPLAAVSLGNAIFFSVLIFCIGFSFSMSPLIAEADAQKNKNLVSKILSHGLLLNISIGLILMVLCWLSIPFIEYLNQPIDVVALAVPYIQISLISLVPFMVFQSYRQLSEGLSLTLPVTIATILANIINIILNYAWIYGNWGFPRLEVKGAAYGTLVARISMIVFLLFILFLWKKSKAYILSLEFNQLKLSLLRKISWLGFPTAFQLFFEVSAFSAAAFICGMVSTTDLAAHQIAINLASISFLLVTGLAVSATIRVGNQFGAKLFKNLRRVGWSNLWLSVLFMSIFGFVFLIFRQELPRLYIEDTTVSSLAANLLIVAAFFQLFDGIQVVSLAALRGMQDVWIPFLITFVAYWVLSIPLAYYLAIAEEMGSFGVWLSLGISLAFSALCLSLRFHFKSKHLTQKEPMDKEIDFIGDPNA